MLLLTAIAFAVRLYHLSYQSLWRDEVDSLLFASRELPTVLASFLKTGENGPLYFLLLRYWVGAGGESEFALRYFSLLFGVLLIPLAYVLGWRLLGRGAALGAALVVALSPYYVWYSQEARMYTAFAFLAALSLYLYLRGWEKGSPRLWAAYVVVTSAGLYIHLFWALVICVELALAIPLARRHASGRRGFLVAATLLVLPYLPLAAWEVPVLLHPPPSAYAFQPPANVTALLLSAFIPSAGPAWVGIGLFLFLALLGTLSPSLLATIEWAGRRGERGKGRKSAFTLSPLRPFAWNQGGRENGEGALLVLLCLVLPVALFYLVSLRLPLFTERYLIVVALPFYLLVGAGLAALGRRSPTLLLVSLLAVLWLSGSSLVAQAHTPIKSDFRAAAAQFAAGAEPGDLVLFVMPYVRHTFAYYYRGDFAWRDPPFTNGGASPAQVDADLRQTVSGWKRVWLVVSEPEWHDARGLIKSWLDEHGRLAAEGHYARVEVYLYELASSGR